MDKISLTGKRIVAGIELLVCLFCLANYYLGFNAFGGYGKAVLILSFVVAALTLLFMGPTVRELEDYQEARRNRRGDK
jgi:hypothetical protein